MEDKDQIIAEEEVKTVVVETPKIKYEDFKKVEIRVGKILSAEKIEKSEKLLKLSVDFAEVAGPRQIVSGIAKYFPDEQVLVGKKCTFVTNLEPRPLMGLESNGMLFAIGGGDVPFSLFEVGDDIPAGTKAN
ncbi:MAG: hypothetical protein WCO10_00255 [bacterium]